MTKITNLSLDIETFSSENLVKSGVYRYSQSEDFEVLLIGYSVDNDEVKVIDTACGEIIPEEIKKAILDPAVTKWAFNAQFERICLSRYFGIYLPPQSWRCTMVWAATLGLPLSLQGAGSVAGIEKQKLKEGKALIRYFSIPCKPTKANNGRIRNMPSDNLIKWELFKAYNLRDVETEMALQKKFSKYPVSDKEWQNYILDQEINDRGIALDMDFVKQAIRCNEVTRERSLSVMKKLTTIENPNSVYQMKQWLECNGVKTETLDKDTVNELIKVVPPDIKEVLLFRQEIAKSSVKKYTAMENAVCLDGRARGLIQFYGANRTGRFSGRILQPQNLPKNNITDLKDVRELIRKGEFAAIEMLYKSVSTVLSELIRTAFVPRKGYKFCVADFSAIEARVIAWLAGEKWRMDVFASHGKIYEASASQMFKVPIEEITKGSILRQKGKVAELSNGYGGSVGALKAMGALSMGLREEELRPLVNAWREANPNIVKLWWNVDKAAMTAVRNKTKTKTHGISFKCQSGMLFITLPSGRNIVYVKPNIGINQFGLDAVTYEGVGSTKKWERIESYGPKFVENIVQAISRDILTDAMMRLNSYGYQIVMHVHDEVIVEVPKGVSSTDKICKIMTKTPVWAKGLQLRAEGYECEFYKKD